MSSSDTAEPALGNVLYWRLSAMFFWQFMALGSWIVPLGTYLLASPEKGGLGLTNNQSSLIFSTFALGTIIAPLCTGVLADKYFSTERVLAVLTFLGALLQVCVAWVCNQYHNCGYLVLLTLFFVFALFNSSTGNLATSLAMRQCQVPKKQLGGIRVWGTIGWIVGGLAVGWCMNAVSAQPLWFAASCSLVLSVYALTLPYTPPLSKSDKWSDLLGLSTLRLLIAPRFAVLFGVAFLWTMIQSLYAIFANKFLYDIEVPAATASQTLAQSAEVVLMFLLWKGINRLGFKAMMIIGLIAFIVRHVIFATCLPFWILVIGLPLNGVNFVCFSMVVSIYLDERGPSDLRASMQGLFAVVNLGIGPLCGNALAAAYVSYFTTEGTTAWANVWGYAGLASLVITMIFVLGFRDEQKPTND